MKCDKCNEEAVWKSIYINNNCVSYRCNHHSKLSNGYFKHQIKILYSFGGLEKLINDKGFIPIRSNVNGTGNK